MSTALIRTWARRLLALVGWVLLLLLIGLPVALGLAMSREDGSRWLLEKGIGFAPGDVHIAHIDGTFLHGLDLRGIHYALPAVTVEAERLQLALAWAALLQQRVAITTLKADALAVTLHETETPDPEPDAEPFSLADIPDIRLPVEIAISSGEINGFSFTPAGGEPITLDRILLAANTGIDNQLHLQQLFVAQGEYQATLGGTVGLLNPFPLDAWLDWQAPLPEAASEALDSTEVARGEARLLGDLSELTLRHRLRSPVALRTEGQLLPFETPLTFNLQNQWEPFTLHTPADAESGTESRTLAVAGGSLALSGSPEAYHLVLESGTQLPDLPALTLALTANGTTEGLNIEQAVVRADRSTARVQGQVDWAPFVRWNLSLALENLDPSLVLPELPGTLQLRTQSQGHLRNDRIAVQVVLEHLSGNLRGHAVSGGGRFALSEDQTLSSDLQLRAGQNRVSLRGSANQQLDINLAIQANQLSALWPGLRGQLNADARVRGTRDLPRLNANATGSGLGFQGWQLANLSLVAGASDPLNDARIDLTLNLDGLHQDGSMLLESARLQGQGTAADHTLRWALQAPDGTLRGAVAGALEDMRAWAGTLQELSVENPLAGRWQLEQPVPLALAPDAARLAPACLVSDGGRLCADAAWQLDGATRAQLDLDAMPLAWLARTLPEGAADIEGSLSLQAQYTDDGRQRTGQAQLTVSEGSLSLASGNDDPYLIRWQGLDLNANLQNDSVNANASFHLDDDNRARARLNAELAGDNTRLDGEFNIGLDELRWLEVFVPQVRNVAGQVRGDLLLGGTVAAPVFSGSLRLADGGAEIPDIGVSLTDLGVLVAARPDGTLDISGSVHSGPGVLGIQGMLVTGGEHPWALELTIQGERFQAVQLPEARVLINPDLRVEMAGNRVVIRGDVLVPEAQFEVNTLPQQAVGVSRDEIIVSEDIETDSPWEIDVEVTVRLGERITFEGFGMSARFAGAVRIEEKPERTTRLTGEVRIVDGRYRAYGQNLRVERGTLIFQGPPDNPGLDIVAVRTVPTYDVRAGLIVGGTLQDPRSQVFSEPAMEETEAMSYLLTGRPLNRASDNDANMIVQAIARYGIERGEFITDRLGQTLGMDIGVDTEGEFEDTALMLGKQLSSRLYLRYSVGLFEALSTVMLRYTLTNSLSLETRSNAEEQAIDLIFRTER